MALRVILLSRYECHVCFPFSMACVHIKSSVKIIIFHFVAYNLYLSLFGFDIDDPLVCFYHLI